MSAKTLLVFAITLTSMPAWSESMRCGKWVVGEDASPSELAQKCGEPQDKQVTVEDVRGVNALGNSVKLGTTVIEIWHYKPSPGALPMTVKIVDGKIKSMERAR